MKCGNVKFQRLPLILVDLDCFIKISKSKYLKRQVFTLHDSAASVLSKLKTKFIIRYSLIGPYSYRIKVYNFLKKEFKKNSIGLKDSLIYSFSNEQEVKDFMKNRDDIVSFETNKISLIDNKKFNSFR